MKPRANKRELIGIVISDKMDKTISVRVETRRLSPQYKKYVKSATIYKAHDEGNEAQFGARVRISETRPLSKTKNWRLLEVIEQGSAEAAEALARTTGRDK